MQEYQIFSVQGASVLPILDVRMSGFDWYMILEASGIRWTQCGGLKRSQKCFSVFEFFRENFNVAMVYSQLLRVSMH